MQTSLVSVLPHHGHTWSCPLLMFWDVSVQQKSIRPSCTPHLEDQAGPGVGLLFSLVNSLSVKFISGTFFPYHLVYYLGCSCEFVFIFKKKQKSCLLESLFVASLSPRLICGAEIVTQLPLAFLIAQSPEVSASSQDGPFSPMSTFYSWTTAQTQKRTGSQH